MFGIKTREERIKKLLEVNERTLGKVRKAITKKYDTYQDYLKDYPDKTSIMYMSEHEWDKVRPTSDVFNGKLLNIRALFANWEYDIKHLGESKKFAKKIVRNQDYD